jgi:branched-chain amino acid aminotransferase
VDDLKVFVGDSIVRAGDAAVSIFDASFQSGDAIWEGMRVYNGRVLFLDRHLDRLEGSSHALRIPLPYPRAAISAAIATTLKANGFDRDTHIRLMVSRGQRTTSGMDPANAPARGHLVIIAEPKPVADEPAPQTLRTASIRRPSPAVLDPSIHHSNQLNSILARLEVTDDPGVDAALMLDSHGYVAEADTANIFCVTSGHVRTPIASSCLHGITRETILELSREAGYETSEEQLTLYDLYTADEVFLTGTVCELVPVTTVDGRQVGTGSPGPVWRDLLTKYRKLVEESTK